MYVPFERYIEINIAAGCYSAYKILHTHFTKHPPPPPKMRTNDHFGTRVHNTEPLPKSSCSSASVQRFFGKMPLAHHIFLFLSLSSSANKDGRKWMSREWLYRVCSLSSCGKVYLCNKPTKCCVPYIYGSNKKEATSQRYELEQMTHLSKVKVFCTLTASISQLGSKLNADIVVCAVQRHRHRHRHRHRDQKDRRMESHQCKLIGVEILKCEWRNASERNTSHNRNRNQSDNVQVQCWYYPVVNGVNYVFVLFNVFSTKLIFDFHCWCRLQSDWIGFRNSHHI